MVDFVVMRSSLGAAHLWNRLFSTSYTFPPLIEKPLDPPTFDGELH